MQIECFECGKKETFGDAKDILYAKWKVISWKVPSGEPCCVCNECEYNKPKKGKLCKSK